MPETHAPPLPLSWRSLAAEMARIKHQLDVMEAEDAATPPEPPLLYDPILFPSIESRIAEIERRHREGWTSTPYARKQPRQLRWR